MLNGQKLPQMSHSILYWLPMALSNNIWPYVFQFVSSRIGFSTSSPKTNQSKFFSVYVNQKHYRRNVDLANVRVNIFVT